MTIEINLYVLLIVLAGAAYVGVAFAFRRSGWRAAFWPLIILALLFWRA